MHATEHVMQLCDLIEQLVRGDEAEIGVHDLDDRPQSVLRGAERHPDETVLGNRRREETVRKAIGDAARPAEGSAAQTVNVLAKNDNPLVALHETQNGGADAVQIDRKSTRLNSSH